MRATKTVRVLLWLGLLALGVIGGRQASAQEIPTIEESDDLTYKEVKVIDRWPIQYIVQDGSGAEFAFVHVYEEEDKDAFIAGRIKRKSGFRGKGGYVALALVHNDSVYFTALSHYVGTYNVYRNRRLGWHFRIDLPRLPNLGDTIRLTYFSRDKYP